MLNVISVLLFSLITIFLTIVLFCVVLYSFVTLHGIRLQLLFFFVIVSFVSDYRVAQKRKCKLQTFVHVFTKY